MHVQTNGVFLSDKSDGIDSDQGRSGSTLVWQGRVLAAGWFLGRTTLDWGSPYREGIAELSFRINTHAGVQETVFARGRSWAVTWSQQNLSLQSHGELRCDSVVRGRGLASRPS